ncbi:aspartate/glutamate racemase family protein [Garciella nitratireducens]|uniref:aspartate/glutamate racemase family protein n=1 Tax=Garciella nitratireducens TaxID=218205 RepID=UPI000DEA360D|nr:aspartate/glutamate racemase family protein [Garciella nitratireducens]RBP37251.1 glutamate racemase [Garciella nitratireducens]
MIAVMAGTPIDTKMGLDILEKEGYQAKGYPISKTSEQQSNLQILYPENLQKIVIEKIQSIKQENIKNIFVYCNSLSGAVNMDKLSKEYDIHIITPLQIYKEVGRKYKRVAVLAANNQSTFAIERVITEKSSSTHVIGIGLLPLVTAIEEKKSPKEIIKSFALENVLKFFLQLDCQALILGCTHFPYFYHELKKISQIPIIDPSYEMIKRIKVD